MGVNESSPRDVLASPELLDSPAGRAGGFRLRSFLVRRVAWGLLTLVCVSILIFTLTHVLPSNPARAVIGQFAEPEQIAAVEKELGLDQSVVTQYFDWIGGVVHGDLGSSYQAKQPVLDLLGQRLENSLTLLALVALLAIPISVALGILAAKRRDSAFDHGVSMSTILLAGLPEFVIGIALTLVFGAAILDILPTVDVTPAGENPLSNPDAMVLPVATLVLAVVPYLSRLVRASMIEALDSSYVEMARLKGVPEKCVLRRHAFRNAMVPMIQASGHTLVYLLGNVVVVEFLFNYPGMGQALANSVGARDLPMIQGIALIFGAMFILFNMIADLLTVYASPRLRTEG
jgi:peptide/nickel transport system permease protein